jgi:hypothetical protein
MRNILVGCDPLGSCKTRYRIIIDSFQSEKRVAGQLTVERSWGIGNWDALQKGQRVPWLTYDKFGVLFNIGSACQKTEP